MPFSFPSNPSVGQKSLQNGRYYVYKGSNVWDVATEAVVASGGGSQRVLYASQHGCAFNANINTGGGTDDTAAIQAMLDTALTAPVTVVIDGVARISDALFHPTNHFPALQVYSNTTIVFPEGCGLFLTANSNVPLIAGGYDYELKNVRIVGGVLNGNAVHQQKQTQERWWPYGLSFFNCENIWLERVRLRNAKTFGFVFSAGNVRTAKRVRMYGCSFLNDDGDLNGSSNKDGVHLWGTIDDVIVDDFLHDGDDDTIALNTDENVANHNSAFASLHFGPPSGGDITNCLFRNIKINGAIPTAGRPYRFIYYGVGTGNCDNIRFENWSSNGSPSTPEFSVQSLGRFSINGWDMGNVPIIGSAAVLGLSNIHPDTAVQATGTKTYGDYFAGNISLPPAPTGLTAVPGNTSMTLSWTAATASPAVTDYEVQYSSNSGSTWTTFADGTSTATDAVVTGLTNGTTYQFRVRAINVLGAGPYSEPATETPSPAAGVVSLLMHFDGQNGSTTFVDSSAEHRQVTAGGGAQISTANSKWGGSSCRIPPLAWIECQSSPSLRMGLSDFTIQTWAYFNAMPPVVGAIWESTPFGGARPDGFIWLLTNSGGLSIFHSANFILQSASGVVPTGQWVHLALTRASGVTRAYVDGVSVGSTTSLGSDTAGGGLIGPGGDSARGDPASAQIDGFLDDYCIVKGSALWSGPAPFTPPTGPLSSSL